MSLPPLRLSNPSACASHEYDYLLIGFGIVSSALSHALSQAGKKVLCIERDVNTPDRIVGELLQPGGAIALKKLGLDGVWDAAKEKAGEKGTVGDVEARGYEIVGMGRTVNIPYPPANVGKSFHHGAFLQSLRSLALKLNPSLDLLHGTVSSLNRDQDGRIVGARATFKNATASGSTELDFTAKITIVVDGCFSKFRRDLFPDSTSYPLTRSHFVGLVLPDAQLPNPKHGLVVLPSTSVPGIDVKLGPILCYQLSEQPHETRMLVDIPGSLPSAKDLPKIINDLVIPNLPSTMRPSVSKCLELAKSGSQAHRIRSMPNQYLPPPSQSSNSPIKGCFAVGDALNMRHPLTGGGMTVGFNDAVILGDLLPTIDEGNWDEVEVVLEEWERRRKGVSVCVNTLAMALYALFGAEDECLDVLRRGCFAYFERGGRSVSDPVSLLSAIRPSPGLLLYHFFYVAFYSIYILFVQPRPSPDGTGKKAPTVLEYPALAWLSVRVFYTAAMVILPVIWREVR
ncbi:SE-domain-containing protein [Atractiella rhizophila]|nr:SE-domain-containing protein [Atractiella rhizophila]